MEGGHDSGGHLLGKNALFLSLGREAFGQATYRALFDIFQNVVHPAARLLLSVSAIRITDELVAPAVAGQVLVRVVMRVASNSQLAKIVFALRTPRRLARRLNSRQQERDENSDDRNDNEQFY
jgi:hypothetical protein